MSNQTRGAIDTLKELGLTEYEAKVYLCSIVEGSIPMRELAFKANVPRTKVYQAVRSLARKGLLKLKERPLRLIPVDADEVFQQVIRQEEKRIKELKGSLARLRRLREEGLKGKSIAEGKYYIYVASEAISKLSDMIEDCQSSFHVFADAHWFDLLTSNCKKQLASLTLKDVDVKVIVAGEKFEDTAELYKSELHSQIRVSIGKFSTGKSIFIADGSNMMIGNASTGGATFLPLADVSSLIEQSFFMPLWDSSIELSRYLKMQSLDFAEEFSSLRSYNVERLLIETMMGKSNSESIDTEFYLRLASAIPSRIFTLKPDAGLPVWTELLDLSLSGRGRVRYDNVTKLISIELNQRAEKLPADPWFIAFLGYLNYNGIPLRIINKVDSDEGTIFQGKIAWNILA